MSLDMYIYNLLSCVNTYKYSGIHSDYSEYALGAIIERVSDSYDLYLTTFLVCHLLMGKMAAERKYIFAFLFLCIWFHLCIWIISYTHLYLYAGILTLIFIYFYFPLYRLVEIAD
jgi:hypothetical protein